tara:strand:+ start:2119 stop:2667 length:549 start_codon:yes stop_codon:yes gene_type:complete
MFIHKSHSKKDLINIIKKLNINIPNPQKYKKVEISALLDNKINMIDSIEPCEELCIYNMIDLKMFLENCNPKKLLTIKERNNIILICKRVKHYCINNYNIEVTDYEDNNELYNEAIYINRYGDIPSVRKTIKLLMNDPVKLCDLNPIISPIIMRELKKKELYKKVVINKLKVNYGKYYVDFN